MKLRFALVLLSCVIAFSSPQVLAQDTNDAAETAERLRGQLSEVQNDEAELKIRLEQITFDLRPENIERHFAGYGSTRPEELREGRRRKLQLEKDRVQSLLIELDGRRQRLESAIAVADAKVYQQSALGAVSLQSDPERQARFFTATRMLAGGVIALLLIGGVLLLIAARKRRQLAA